MASINFEWNDGWEQDLLDEVGQNIETQYQATFDRLGTYEGRPKDEIRDALRRELELDDGPSEDWVDAIHDGTRIVVELEFE